MIEVSSKPIKPQTQTKWNSKSYYRFIYLQNVDKNKHDQSMTFAYLDEFSLTGLASSRQGGRGRQAEVIGCATERRFRRSGRVPVVLILRLDARVAVSGFGWIHPTNRFFIFTWKNHVKGHQIRRVWSVNYQVPALNFVEIIIILIFYWISCLPIVWLRPRKGTMGGSSSSPAAADAESPPHASTLS